MGLSILVGIDYVAHCLDLVIYQGADLDESLLDSCTG